VDGALNAAQLKELISQDGPFSPGSTVAGDEMLEAVTEILRHNAHPEYMTVMVSEAVTQDYPGVEGFAEAWSEWTSPYESFRVVLEEVLLLEDKLVFVVRQIATTRHSEVEVESPSAAVWWMEDGQIRQAAFYLDRQAGLKAAGIASPDRPTGA
jgi:ketosteroid isomerase-like protein